MKYITISLVTFFTSILSPQSSDLIIESGAVFYVYDGSQITSDYITVNQDGGFYSDDPSGVAPGTIIQGDGDWSLPVELTSFTVKLQENKIILKWTTETELNNYGFDIERNSLNGIWLKIGFVEGHGNSNSPKIYSFNDSNPIGGSKFLYRLKQIDTDGQYEYSDVVEVEIVPNEFALFQNYPNPFNPNTIIRFQLPIESKVVINVYDMLGSEVLSLLNVKRSAGVYEVEFNVSNLPSGSYIYRMAADNFFETKKMILLK